MNVSYVNFLIVRLGYPRTACLKLQSRSEDMYFKSKQQNIHKKSIEFPFFAVCYHNKYSLFFEMHCTVCTTIRNSKNLRRGALLRNPHRHEHEFSLYGNITTRVLFYHRFCGFTTNETGFTTYGFAILYGFTEIFQSTYDARKISKHILIWQCKVQKKYEE